MLYLYNIRNDVWTNIFYFIAGILTLTNNPALGIALVYLAAASYMGHKYRGKWWVLDWSAMYYVFAIIIATGFGVSWLWALPVIALPYVIPKTIDSFFLIGVFFTASLLTLTFPAILYTLLVFALAFAVRQLHFGLHEVNSHSVWHLITAIGFVFFTF